MSDVVRVSLADRARAVPYDIHDLLDRARFGAVAYGPCDRLRVAGCLGGMFNAAGLPVGSMRETSLATLAKRLPCLTVSQVNELDLEPFS